MDEACTWTVDHAHASRTSRMRERMRTHVVSNFQVLEDECIHG